MENYCLIHSDRKSLNFCKVCKNYYCVECLDEGPEYYYCKNEECQQELINALNNKEVNEFANAEKKKNSVFYELRKSNFPFYIISLFVATFLGIRYSRINELGIVDSLLYILGASIGLWGFPILITILLGIVITIKELRSKIFLYIYTTIWLIVVLLTVIGLNSFAK